MFYQRRKLKLLVKKNKKGAIGIIIFVSVLFILLLLGFGLTIVLSVIDIASDELTPIMADLGMAGDTTNLSEYSEYTFGTMDSVVQALPWVLASGFIMALIFTLVFIFIVGYSPHPAFIGAYIGLMVLLIFGCILVSNMYQDIYSAGDDIALRLQEQTIMSHMILNSPFIMAMIMVIGGILMFTRQSATEGGGGFGV